MSAISALGDIVRAYTRPYRKGARVQQAEHGAVTVVTIDDFPEIPDRAVLVDVHFIEVGFTEAAADKQAFLDALKAALNEPGVFADLDVETLQGGPSYIGLGAWLGDQTLALCFQALGEHYGLWEVMTPKRLHMPESMWDEVAGAGLVMGAPQVSADWAYLAG
jgi:hypothetical protein